MTCTIGNLSFTLGRARPAPQLRPEIAETVAGNAAVGEPDGRENPFAPPPHVLAAHLDADLITQFADALHAKMDEARAKGRAGWHGLTRVEEIDALRAQLAEHVRKGDPRDVAILAAMLWAYGEATA